jgi:hypothetical protein
MRSKLFVVVAACALAGGSLAPMACTANVHDNTINVKDPKVEFNTDVDVENVQTGQAIPVHIEAENVYPVAPDLAVPPGHGADAGYFQIYLDDADSDPLLVTAQTNVSVTIPKETEEGDHTLICRVHKHDGTATSAKFEIKIHVKAEISTGG